MPQVNITPALVQNEIHPYYQEPDVVPYIQELGITVQGWYPFGGRGHTSELLGDETISAIAEAHGVTSSGVWWSSPAPATPTTSGKILTCSVLS